MTARSCGSCATPVPDDAAFCPNCGEATAADLDAEFGAGFEERLKQALSDRYTIERELGRGGMAVVYLAHDRKLGRDVALKVLRAELAASVGAERFLREIEIAANLAHPNILALHDGGDADGALYYTMPFVDGESLRDRLNREKQLPIDEALRIARDIADGLDHAHAHGVIHRDVKPENVLLADDRAIVADFGIARAVSSLGGETLTTLGLVLGTPLYMSPEQGSGDRDVDARADLYSLGCVVYEMLAGEPPFTGNTNQAILAKHALEPRPDVRTLRDTVPAGMQTAIHRAMAKSPADRFGSAGQFVEHLRRAGSRRFWWPRRRVVRALTVLAAVAVVAYGATRAREWLSPAGTADSAIPVGMLDPNRIAVLYFEDLSADGSLGHVARGLTEDLIGELSWVRALHVTSPEGVRPFRNREVTVDSIGRALSVGSVVGGSIARAGDVLRVRVRLLDPATAEELFSQSFQEDVGDVFALQERLSDEVALFLRERLGREVVLREWERAASPAAWDLVNRAEELADEGSRLVREGRAADAIPVFHAADSLAARAEALDSAWIEPALMRGRVAYSMAFADRADPRWLSVDWLQRGVQHAERALRIDSMSPDALAMRGELRYRLGEWTSGSRDSAVLALAEADLQRALDIEPGLAGGWYVLGEAQYYANRFREAKTSLTTAYRADAYLTQARTVVQLLFSSSLEVEEFEDAREWCETGRRRFPGDVRFVDCEIVLLGWTGRGPQHIARALEVLDEVVRSDTLGAFGPKPAFDRMWIAALYARSGMDTEARAFIDSAQASARALPGADVDYIEAYVRLLLGQTNEALRLLRGYLERYPEQRGYLSSSPLFRSVRSRAEFAQLLGG